MTKDLYYIVRLDENDHNQYLAKNNLDEYYADLDVRNAAKFRHEDEIKSALKYYFKYVHEMKEKDHAFVCKVSATDCAAFVKSDIDLLLKN